MNRPLFSPAGRAVSSPGRAVSSPGRRLSHLEEDEDTAVLLRGPRMSHLRTVREDSYISNRTQHLLDDSCLSVRADTSLLGNYSSQIDSQESLDALHEQFYEILELYKEGQTFSFDMVNDFHSICTSFMHSQASGSEVEKWLFEEGNTWRLLHTLMEDRLRGDGVDDDDPMGESDRARSEKEVMLEVFKKDSVTRQCQLVVDWLESCESIKRSFQQNLRAEHFTDKTVTWENTVLQLKEKHIPYSTNTKIVSEIDPDAPRRENLPIHKLDAEDEVLLLSQILSHIRCGQLEQAQKLCVHCGQPWRAATLEGWRLYHNPNLENGKKDNLLLPTEGNPNRDIWKLASWRLAEDKQMPSSARTTYAALCGHLEAILVNMETWHDWLWAHLKAMIDVRIEEEIRAKCSSRIYVDMPMKYWSNKMNLSQIFAALASSPDSRVRLEHAKELASVQRYLILDDMNTLYAALASWARQATNFQDPMSALLIRFAAHLVLVLRAMGKEETDNCVAHGNEVMRIYTQLIISLGNPGVIMSYVAKLPPSEQVRTLARYLETVVDPEKKARSLQLAAEQGLDVDAAAQCVVESIRGREQQRTGELMRGTSPEDQAKVDALDWLVVYPSQYSEALWQANAVARQFVAQGKLDAARSAFEKLPSDILAVMLQDQIAGYPDLEDLDSNLSPRHRSAVREHLSLKIYLDAQLSFSAWFDFFYQQRPAEPERLPKDAPFQKKLVHEEDLKQYQQELARWRKRLNHLAQEARGRLFNILTFPSGGWLGCGLDLEQEGATPDVVARQRELEALCKLCIPQAALLIHELSVQSGEPQGSMQLADILASERYGLHRCFSKEKLRELLTKVSEACVELLKMKKDPWGHPVTS